MVEQGEHLAEDLCGVAAVDLLDDHDVVVFGVLAGVLGGGEQRAVDQGEFAVGAGPEPADEVFVGHRRVKLQEGYPVGLTLVAQHPAKASGEPRLAGSGWPLPDDVLLRLHGLNHRFQELNVEERAIGNDVGDDVLRCDFPRCRLGTESADSTSAATVMSSAGTCGASLIAWKCHAAKAPVACRTENPGTRARR